MNSTQVPKRSLLHLLAMLLIALCSSKENLLENFDILKDLDDRSSYIVHEARRLTSFRVDLFEEGRQIVRSSAVRMGTVLEKHFQKLQQNCDALEREAHRAEHVTKQHDVEFFPAKTLLDFNVTLIYSKRSVHSAFK